MKVGGVDVHDLDPTCCGTRSGSCRSGRTCSREPSRATCSSASPTRPRTRCGPRSRSRRPPTSSAPCRAVCTPGSNRAAPTSRAGSASDSRSHARSIRRPDIYVFDDSFSALDLTTDARLRAALGPYTKDAAVVIVAQRVSTIATADNILVLEDGLVIGRGTHDELIQRLPDVRGDRAVADRREERRGMTIIDDPEEQEHDEAEELDLSAPEVRAAGRWNSAGVPGERSKDFKNALRRLGRMLGPMWVVLVMVVVIAVTSATLNVFGPLVLGHGTDIIVRGVRTAQHGLQRVAPRAPQRVVALRGVVAALDLGVVHARRDHSAADVQAALRRGGQGQRPAAQLHRQAAARRPAQPRHQRHRQRRAEPATDAEPDAHFGAVAHRCRDHDVHDLAAARRSSRSRRCRSRCSACARSRSARGRGSSRSGRAPACSTRRSRRRSPATRS